MHNAKDSFIGLLVRFVIMEIDYIREHIWTFMQTLWAYYLLKLCYIYLATTRHVRKQLFTIILEANSSRM